MLKVEPWIFVLWEILRVIALVLVSRARRAGRGAGGGTTGERAKTTSHTPGGANATDVEKEKQAGTSG